MDYPLSHVIESKIKLRRFFIVIIGLIQTAFLTFSFTSCIGKKSSSWGASSHVLSPSHGGAGEELNACGARGGLCLNDAVPSCSKQGGIDLKLSEACPFDSPAGGRTFGTCCQPPKAKSCGASCAEEGGLCASIGGLRLANGHFAESLSCNALGVGIACGVPFAVCGPETVWCVKPNHSTFYAAVCSRDGWKCTMPGTVLVPKSPGLDGRKDQP